MAQVGRRLVCQAADSQHLPQLGVSATGMGQRLCRGGCCSGAGHERIRAAAASCHPPQLGVSATRMGERLWRGSCGKLKNLHMLAPCIYFSEPCTPSLCVLAVRRGARSATSRSRRIGAGARARLRACRVQCSCGRYGGLQLIQGCKTGGAAAKWGARFWSCCVKSASCVLLTSMTSTWYKSLGRCSALCADS